MDLYFLYSLKVCPARRQAFCQRQLSACQAPAVAFSVLRADCCISLSASLISYASVRKTKGGKSYTQSHTACGYSFHGVNFFHNISSPKYKHIIYFSRCNVYAVPFIITQNPVLVKKPTAKSRIFGILRQFATHILCVIAPILLRTSHPRSFL